MAKKASFSPLRSKWTGTRSWVVNIPPSYSPSGKRERAFFSTKQEAQDHCDGKKIELLNHGVGGSHALSPAQIDEATRAFALIEDIKGSSVFAIVAGWLGQKKEREASRSMESAVSEYRAHLDTKKIKGRPVSDAYKRQVRNVFDRFAELRPVVLTDITGRQLLELVAPLPGASRNAALRTFSAFFEWCRELPRGWMASNPAKDVPKASVGTGEIQTFSAADVSKLFGSLAETNPGLIPYYSLAFFAGIRPHEIGRVEWSMIDLAEGHIVLPGKITKTGHRRVIEVNDTLRAWLESFISANGIQLGAVVQSRSLRDRLRAAVATAGIEWHQDGARHTFASAWLAAHKDEHRLREQLGHKSSDVLWNHYHRATTEREAKEFWAIRPSTGKKVVKFREVAA